MTLRHSRRYSKSINSLTGFLEAADDVSQALYVLRRRGGDLCLFRRIAPSKIHQSVNSNNSTSRAGECSTARHVFVGSRESTYVGEGDAEGGEEGGVALGDGSGVPLHGLHRRRHLTRGGRRRWGRRDRGSGGQGRGIHRRSHHRRIAGVSGGRFHLVCLVIFFCVAEERQRARTTCLGLVAHHVLRWPAGT
jgi:hypothetical protein